MKAGLELSPRNSKTSALVRVTNCTLRFGEKAQAIVRSLAGRFQPARVRFSRLKRCAIIAGGDLLIYVCVRQLKGR